MSDFEGAMDTRLAQACHAIDPDTGAVAPALHPSTTFARGADHELMGDFVYGRYGSPTVSMAERVVCELDRGAEAMLFGSGLGATTTLLDSLGTGDHIIAPTVMYHGALDWMRRLARRRGVGLTQFDATDPDGLGRAVAEHAPTLVWIESPVNPTWDVIDIEAAAGVTHEAGGVLVVDSTVAPPVTTRPLELGAYIVLHSATKYLNGHSDVLGGVLVTGSVTERWEEVRQIRKYTGGIMAPFDAWLLVRGMRTLGVRYDRCSANALKIARHLEGHPSVERVLYPGLESHPGHAVARTQMTRGFGGMLSLLVRGDGEATKALTTRLRVFIAATSLGGVESLAEHRASVEGPDSIVPENLLRLSVGIEDVDDLIADLEAALAGVDVR